MQRKDDSSRRGPGSSRDRAHHRPNRSEDQPQYKKGPNGLRIPIKPSGRRDSPTKDRRRRNSESSTMEKPLMTKEEWEAKERRKREREARHREREQNRTSKVGDKEIGHSASSRRRKNVHVDVVDKLDVTGGLYGTGSMWHHDGPFDACQPHRNRKKDTFAPMGAFPTNSANQTIGGSGPINNGTHLVQVHGLSTAEGFNDYSQSAAKPFPAMKTALVNPVNRVEPVHGEESLGLGTSTFLEGAPASRQAIQRTQSEQTTTFGDLTRKKSLAMRFRGMSQSKGRYNEPPPQYSKSNFDKGRFQDRSAGISLADGPVGSPMQSPEAPRPATSRNAENNPFESHHDDAYEKKGASIKIAEAGLEKNGGRERSLSSPKSPKRGILERRVTADNSSPEQKPAGGFLNRVKSLKGGPRRAKTERHAS
ncbi:Pal1-domain-containing protein [Microthyrium microscopicum]|uniref:Pal1-domain-containing protein n=1 Tax=Microthyrium microscopicum TaxID=703497 RepID=A0A6A6UAL5_9PEZI|nr:Pal1-domain-containing protein [Microthyrium microscopicum]